MRATQDPRRGQAVKGKIARKQAPTKNRCSSHLERAWEWAPAASPPRITRLLCPPKTPSFQMNDRTTPEETASSVYSHAAFCTTEPKPEPRENPWAQEPDLTFLHNDR